MSTTAVTYIGGPTVLLEWAGLRIVTDPTFDAPQSYSEPGTTTLTKTHGPGIPRSDLGPVDLVLLSHHTHKDNLDWEGLELVAAGPLTIGTREAASDLWGGSVVGYDDWESHQLGDARITVVPAQHRPAGAGDVPVVGFVLEAPDAPTVYVSGDNLSLGLVKQISENFPDIRLAVLNAGAARVPSIDGALTLTSTDAATAADTLGVDAVVGVHCEDWEHYSESRADLEAAFAAAGRGELLLTTPRAERVEIAL
ncbi:MBL fold metallo-hydrolase [Schumannella sp. 10F1B-5-1]|uniref:MBL fold metallo-hydrolase n=1 Tax=Schumannella sp. 10F1B-5-1 TaxID=2590780 RepID=UPI00113235F3|nr:MBL fold metallo-hydrolase [Schumannella sp. 10F1B-5-1]TPW72977.1 MBL fold metallo-hydrolase [Schumannella sp. 10F1B-5-1]